MSKKKEEKMTDQPYGIETRVALLELSISTINQTLVRLENTIASGFEKIDTKFEKIELKIEKLDSKLSSRFFWLLGLYLAGCAGILTVIAKSAHWF